MNESYGECLTSLSTAHRPRVGGGNRWAGCCRRHHSTSFTTGARPVGSLGWGKRRHGPARHRRPVCLVPDSRGGMFAPRGLV